MKKLQTLATAAALGLLLAITGCALPNMPEFTTTERAAVTDDSSSISIAESAVGSETDLPIAYRQWDESINLEWDAAVGAVAHYRVYVRRREGGVWELLAEVPAGEAPSLEVRVADTGSGSFEFAVSSVAPDGTESERHTSLDDDADPPTGWYVVWE